MVGRVATEASIPFHCLGLPYLVLHDPVDYSLYFIDRKKTVISLTDTLSERPLIRNGVVGGSKP